MRRVVTFGTFDVLHVGHVLILERARALGDQLIVGVSSDDLNFSKKGRRPIYTQKDRVHIISALRCVDEVFIEESLEKKGDYLVGRPEFLEEGPAPDLQPEGPRAPICEVVYLPRTPSISTTEIIEVIRQAT